MPKDKVRICLEVDGDGTIDFAAWKEDRYEMVLLKQKVSHLEKSAEAAVERLKADVIKINQACDKIDVMANILQNTAK